MIFCHTHTETVPAPHQSPTLSGCSLQSTRITAGISGFIAEVRVEQEYRNPSDHNLNTQYTFPLPHDAAVCAFEFTVAGKVIHSAVREKDEARAAFAQARVAGKRAALMEQNRPNVFTLELANVPARSDVKAVVTYLEALPYRSGEFELRIPTVVAPRYTPAGAEATPGVSGGATHTLAFDADVDAGMEIESWNCATHALTAHRAGPDRLRLSLATDRPDRDLVLTYRVGGAGVKLGLVTYRPDPAQEGWFYLMAVPPADVSSDDVRGKELIFLLDRSGSMQGPKMTQARQALVACLRALNPNDAFAIYAFDDKNEPFEAKPVPFTQAALERAESWLGHVQARGGTEILAPLSDALALPADPARQRVVVLITDGQVSNESALIGHVRQQLRGARLFTVGVDTAVNAHLLHKLAQMGKGACQLVLPSGDIEGAIAGLCQRFGSPLMTDPVAEFGAVRVSDLTPHPLPDLMAGQVIAVAGRYRGAGHTTITFSGQGPGRLLEHKVDVKFPAESRENPLIEKIWARLMLDRHEDTLLDDPNSSTMKAKIVALAKQHGLASTLTSFLAIDERDGDERLAREAITSTEAAYMPAQWEMPAPAARKRASVSALSCRVAAPQACAAPAPAGRGGGFLSKLESLAGDVGEMFDSVKAKITPAVDDLRELAKKQRADGSWNGTVDDTADAILRFVQAGHTDRSGAYQAQVRRAIEWLDRTLKAGAARDAAKVLTAVAALAAATGSAQHRALEARLRP